MLPTRRAELRSRRPFLSMTTKSRASGGARGPFVFMARINFYQAVYGDEPSIGNQKGRRAIGGGSGSWRGIAKEQIAASTTQPALRRWASRSSVPWPDAITSARTPREFFFAGTTHDCGHLLPGRVFVATPRKTGPIRCSNIRSTRQESSMSCEPKKTSWSAKVAAKPSTSFTTWLPPLKQAFLRLGL